MTDTEHNGLNENNKRERR